MENSKSGGKAKWSKETLHIFCDICIRAIDMGMRSGSHFEKGGWKYIVKSFGEKTSKPLQKDQLKNKWDVCKKDWRLWNKLIGETGVGWSNELGTIAASDEWWQSRIQVIFSLNIYYITYIHKEPCMISYNTRMRWLNDILRGHWKRSVNMFRMDKDTLLGLCHDLETRYGLKPSRRMCVLEKVGMFLFTLAVGASNRHVQERFQHSGETVSRCMKEVLKAVSLFAIDIIKPTDPDFTNTPIEIAMNPRFMPHFKNCIGAIDETHVCAMISPENQIPFIGRKGVPTQNVMAACSFDMQFTFVWAGWEGSAHDTRIFLEAINSRSIKFPKPPEKGSDIISRIFDVGVNQVDDAKYLINEHLEYGSKGGEFCSACQLILTKHRLLLLLYRWHYITIFEGDRKMMLFLLNMIVIPIISQMSYYQMWLRVKLVRVREEIHVWILFARALQIV
ncbi:protein ALP [Salix suchowensis]|nr:protein ALP [Salix suchowensis]